MEKQQVKVIIDFVNPHGILAADETEVAPQLGKKGLEIGDDSGLKPFSE